MGIFLRWNSGGLHAAFGVVGILMITGCVSPRTRIPVMPVAPQVIESAARFKKEYVLAAGDQIEVSVLRMPELSRTQAIRPDGNISLPVIKQVSAAGLTARELNEKLATLFAARLVDPEVTVIPVLVRQPVIYVTGDVANSMAVPFRDAPTAIQAITLAGGFRRTAASRDVAIIRLSELGHVEAIEIDAKNSGQPDPYMALRAMLLQPDDIIFVPEGGRSQMNRFLDDFVTRPLQGINGLVGTYVNFKLIDFLRH